CGAIELVGRSLAKSTESRCRQRPMFFEFARKSNARVEVSLAQLSGLSGCRRPGGPVPLQLSPVEVLEPVDAAGGDQRPCMEDPHGFDIAGGVALVVVDIGQRG